MNLRKVIIVLPAILSIPIIVLRLIGKDVSFLPENILDILALSCLVAITGSLYFLDNDDVTRGFERLNHRVADAFLFSKGNVTAIRPANEPSIWVGFKNKFYALNPPLKMNFASDEKYSNMVKSHAERFADSDFKSAYYVFYTKGEPSRYFPNALGEFEKFMKDIAKTTPCVLEKVNVTVVELPAPGFTFFVGSKILQLKEGSRTCSYSISYINERPLVYENGFSNWAFISLAKDFNTTIENYCLDIVNTHGWVSLKEHLAKS